MEGRIDEFVDRDAGRYDVRIGGAGTGVANLIESTGHRRGDAWLPLRTDSWFQVQGRESRSEILYDHDRRSIKISLPRRDVFLPATVEGRRHHFRSADVHVDNMISALLNYTDDRWTPRPDGAYGTHVVRRHRRDEEGTDDVDLNERAELVLLTIRITMDAATGKPIAAFDMTRSSSLARRGGPARLILGTNRRPEVLTSALTLGTSLTVRFEDSS